MGAPASEGPRIRVAGLMQVAGRVVLVRHRSGSSSYHLLPGGGVRYRETLAEALVREIAEETGLTATVGRPLFISDTIDPDGPRHVVNITFAAEVTGGTVCDRSSDPRVEAVDLIDPDRLTTLDLRPPCAAEIVAALEQRDGVDLRYLGPLFTEGR